MPWNRRYKIQLTLIPVTNVLVVICALGPGIQQSIEDVFRHCTKIISMTLLKPDFHAMRDGVIPYRAECRWSYRNHFHTLPTIIQLVRNAQNDMTALYATYSKYTSCSNLAASRCQPQSSSPSRIDLPCRSKIEMSQIAQSWNVSLLLDSPSRWSPSRPFSILFARHKTFPRRHLWQACDLLDEDGVPPVRLLV